MPNSVLWVGLVAIWLFVLVPMFIKGRPEVAKTTDALRQTRLLHRGGRVSATRSRRGSGAHPHDASYRSTRAKVTLSAKVAAQKAAEEVAAKEVATEDVAPDDSATVEVATVGTDDVETVQMRKVEAEEAEIFDAELVEDSDAVEAEEAAADETADVEDAEIVDHADDVTEVIEVVDADDEIDDEEAEDEEAESEVAESEEAEYEEAEYEEDEYDDYDYDNIEYVDDDETAEYAAVDYSESADDEAADDDSVIDDSVFDDELASDDAKQLASDRPRGRGGYNPDVDRERGDIRYRERQRVLVSLFVVSILAVVSGVVFGLFGWVATGVALVALFGYLLFLRRAVRNESKIRADRTARLERTRRESDERRRREIADPELAERIPPRLRRPGAVVLEADDEDPVFDHLPPFQRRRMMRQERDFRRVG